MATNEFPIVGGPSKWDLSTALFDRKHRDGRKVILRVNNCPLVTEYEMQVSSVQAEDGSGESWNIEGYATPKEDARGSALAEASRNPGKTELEVRSHRVFVYFRTDKRNGYIRFFD